MLNLFQTTSFVVEPGGLFSYMAGGGCQIGPGRRGVDFHHKRAASSRYDGRAVRAANLRNGVGRPPKRKRA